VQIFKDRGIDVDFQPNLGKDKTSLPRSSAIMTALRSAPPPKRRPRSSRGDALKVIGRAGIGVDNVEIPAARRRGSL